MGLQNWKAFHKVDPRMQDTQAQMLLPQLLADMMLMMTIGSKLSLTILIPKNIWLIGTWLVVKIMTCFATNIGLHLFCQLYSNKFPIEMQFPLMQL